tara:strand:+ start:330 stop:614 length:285 start_codon:yes stop_codon:yes gene_type:complete
VAKDIIDFETKKSIHFTITRETHSNLRIECFKYKVSMQDVFEELSQRISAGNPEMILFLKDLSRQKRDKAIKKLSETDAESLFNVIEEESPIMD